LDASHTLTDNGGFQRLSFRSTTRYQGAEYSPAGNNTGIHSGLFTSSSMQTTALPTDSSDVILWDRVPAQDLKEMEMPSKVEWFACPEGPITVESDTRYGINSEFNTYNSYFNCC
jgi:hypothetical protein